VDDVGHEGVAGDQPTAGQGDCESADVHGVAGAAAALGEVASKHDFEMLLACTLDSAPLVRERRASGKVAQKLEQRQIRPSSELEQMGFGLWYDDRSTRDGRSQGRLELPEGGLPFHHAAQVVLIEIEKERRRVACYAPSTPAARS
jgi:hypothetical protein